MLIVPRCQELFKHICIFTKIHAIPQDDNYLCLQIVEKDTPIMFPLVSKYKNVTFTLDRQDAAYYDNQHYMEWKITSNITQEDLDFIKQTFEDYSNNINTNNVNVYVFQFDNWTYFLEKPKRPLSSVFLSNDIDIVQDFKHFTQNKEFYSSNFIPYTRTYLLEGPPGTGKTSIIHALASEYKYNICMLEMNALNNDNIKYAFQKTPKKSFIIIEDIEHYLKHFDFNILDGFLSTDDKCIFITTNDKSKLNNTFLRRIDKMYTLNYANYTQILSLGIDKNIAKEFSRHKTTINIIQKFLTLNQPFTNFESFNNNYFSNQNTTFYS